MSGWIDAHLHLQDPLLLGNATAHLNAAHDAGVSGWIVNGCEPSDWELVHDLSLAEPAILPAYGLHPWWIGQAPADWLNRLSWRLHARPGPLGEIGLDRWKTPRDEEYMETVFVQQIRLAREIDIPVIVHCLKAWDWLLQILKREPMPTAGWMVHGFGESPEVAERLTAAGAYISFCGATLDPKRGKVREALLRMPRERILIETDAPDMLPPVTYQSHPLAENNGTARNAPANLAAIGEGLAGILDIPMPEFVELTRANTLRFLGSFAPEAWQ